MSRLKRRQEKGKYFQTHHFLLIFTLPETDCKKAFCQSLFCNFFHTCLVSSPGLVWHLGKEKAMKSLITFLDSSVSLWVVLPFCYFQRVFLYRISSKYIEKFINCLFCFLFLYLPIHHITREKSPVHDSLQSVYICLQFVEGKQITRRKFSKHKYVHVHIWFHFATMMAVAIGKP